MLNVRRVVRACIKPRPWGVEGRSKHLGDYLLSLDIVRDIALGGADENTMVMLKHVVLQDHLRHASRSGLQRRTVTASR